MNREKYETNIKRMHKITLSSLLRYIRSLENDKFIIAIDGPSGSGKTSLANYLSSEFDTSIIRMDDFFPLKNSNVSMIHIDEERFRSEIVDQIINNTIAGYNRYDCTVNKFSYKQIPNDKSIIIEGTYSSYFEKYDFIDVQLFLNINLHDQLNRLKRREDRNKFEKYVDCWIPKENEYFNSISFKAIKTKLLNVVL